MMVEKEIPNAIKRLKLSSAFKGYNPSVFDCCEFSSEERIMVVDDDYTHTSQREEDSNRCCICLNPNRHELIILPLDKKLIKQRIGGMADGATFDENKFAFIEFKDHAQGNTPLSIEETYRKAIKQLTAALNLFINKLNNNTIAIDFTKAMNVSCHIIVSEKFPRASALEQNMMLEFAMTNDGVGLSFEKEIEF